MSPGGYPYALYLEHGELGALDVDLQGADAAAERQAVQADGGWPGFFNSDGSPRLTLNAAQHLNPKLTRFKLKKVDALT